MKLVRLVSDDSQGLFSNDLVDLILKPQSKIALSSINFDTEDDELVISESNNGIDMTINSQNNIKSINLGVGETVNKTNAVAFMNVISHAFNTTLNYLATNADRGVEIEAKFLDIENRARIGYRNARLVTESTGNHKAHTLNVVSNYTDNNAVFSPSDVVGVPATQKLVFFRNFLAKGSGMVACRILKSEFEADPDEEGFILGVTATNMRLIQNQFLNSQYKIAIRARADAGLIQIALNGGAFTDTAETLVIPAEIDNRPNFVIRRTGTVLEAILLRFNIGTGLSEEVVLGTVDYEINESELFTVIKFLGVGDGCEVDRIKHYFSPYQDEILNNKNSKSSLFVNGVPQRNPSLSKFNVIAEDGLEDLNNLLGAVNPLVRTGSTVTNNFLEFLNEDDELANGLSSFLGYRHERYPQGTGFIKSANFEVLAENRFRALNNVDSYIVELLNLNVESYDGNTGRKRSILYTVPANNENTFGTINFNASPLIFLDINNVSEFLVRTIRLRILEADGTSVSTRGLNTCTLLFD